MGQSKKFESNIFVNHDDDGVDDSVEEEEAYVDRRNE